MEATDEDILQNVAIPEEDGKLQEALANLDAKLAAWSGAIQHAQSSLKEVVVSKEVPATPEPAPEPAPELVAVKAEKKPPAQAVVVEKSASVEEKAPEPPPAVYVPHTEAPDEDEALLATLDPETAKRIQVLRRLTGPNKSIRELIEKHHLTVSPSSPASTQRKSFWRRQDK